MSALDFDKMELRLKKAALSDFFEAVQSLRNRIASGLAEEPASNSATVAIRAHDMVDGLVAHRVLYAMPFVNVLETVRHLSYYAFAILVSKSSNPDHAEAANIYKRVATKFMSEEYVERVRDEPGYIYFVQHTGQPEIKIGFAIDVDRRMAAFRTAMPHGITELLRERGTLRDEERLHRQFHHLRISKNNEWFEAADDLLKYVKTAQSAASDADLATGEKQQKPGGQREATDRLE